MSFPLSCKTSWVAGLLSALLSMLLHTTSHAETAPDSEALLGSDAFKAAVRQYLTENPQVVIEAIQNYQTQQRRAARKQQDDAAQRLRKELDNNAADPVIGNAEGDVTLVEFFDYKCPYCHRAATVIQDLIKNDPNVKVVMKEFPILGPDSVVAARAALAANQQGRYSDYHFELMHNSADLSLERLRILARKLDLDLAKFDADMNAPETARQIVDNQKLATALGVRGTPAFFMDGHTLPPDTTRTAFQEKIADIRARQN